MTPADSATAYFGVAMGIFGPMVSLVGFGISMAARVDAENDAEKSRLAAVELAIIGGGAGIAAGGWLLYARNRKPRLTETPIVTHSAPDTVRVGAIPVLGGGALTATMTF